MGKHRHDYLLAAALLTIALQPAMAQDANGFRFYPPMRALPTASARPLDKGPAYFIDAVKGDDQAKGAQQAPWKTLSYAVKQLKPGDTLYVRGGTYYGTVSIAVAGTVEKPITIRSYPGELVILDAGHREFYEDPDNSWEPVPQGAEGEYRSKKTYASGGGFGNFGDSMVPFQRYLTFSDLRSKNELFHKGLSNRADDPVGAYAGPGVRRDPASGRIHIRLAHTKLAGLGDLAYRGETDPRKLPLVITGNDYTVRIEGAKHLRLQDLVVRGAERAAILIGEDSEDTEQDAENIQLDGLTLYGSSSALRTTRTKGLKAVNCAFRGHAAPWHSRFHHKDRSGAGYLVMAAGRDFEFANCELTDHHDCIQFLFVDGMSFHHNLVDNINDDAIEPGPKKPRGKTLVYQNVLTRCLNPFTAHANKPTEVKGEPGSGLYVCRNLLDFRQGTYKAPPDQPDPTGAFLNHPTTCVGHDHGGPIWANYYFYQNTCLLPAAASRDFYAFTWGSHMRGTTRRVFNNIFVQVDGVPGLNFAMTTDDDFQADGNLLWGLKDGTKQQGDYFAKFRQSKLFTASKKQYAAGWGAHDVLADPKFVRLELGGKAPPDFRLRDSSPAADAGVELPADWFDPLRKQDKGKPDIGAFPLGAEALTVGRK